MNVDDIADDTIPTDFTKNDKLDWIFARQHQLFCRYLPIETSNGLRHHQECPVPIDDRHGQAQIKDFFWRVTEELTEAVDAVRIHAHIENHTREELADALHFLVEVFLLSDITAQGLISEIYGDQAPNGDKLDALFPDNCQTDGRTFESYVYEVVHHIGCAGNFLKQRPWKCTHQLVDTRRYRQALVKSFPALMCCFYFTGMTSHQVFSMYFKKSEVNQFRIRSNY